MPSYMIVSAPLLDTCMWILSYDTKEGAVYYFVCFHTLNTDLTNFVLSSFYFYLTIENHFLGCQRTIKNEANPRGMPYILLMKLCMYGIEAAKRDLVHIFQDEASMLARANEMYA